VFWGADAATREAANRERRNRDRLSVLFSADEYVTAHTAAQGPGSFKPL